MKESLRKNPQALSPEPSVKKSGYGSAVVARIALSRAGEPWTSNLEHGKSVGLRDAPDMARLVGIKILRDKHQGSPDLIRPFIEEAKVTGQL